MKSKIKSCALLLVAFGLAACGNQPASSGGDTQQTVSSSADGLEAKKHEVYELYVRYAQSNGTNPKTYEEWLETIKGERGSSLINGTTDPTSSLGSDGDIYVNTATWDVFAKNDGSWSKAGNVLGKQGEQGDAGKSAYQIYCESHPDYQGDEQQWLDDLTNGRLGNQEKTCFKVTFDLGHDGLSFDQTVEEGKKAKKPEAPERNGYRFVDWVDENGDHWSFNGFTITEDIIIHAVWSDPIQYMVTFLNNDGTELEVQTAHYGDVVEYKGDEPVAGEQDVHYIYKFAGWDKELVVRGDMSLVAQYSTSYLATTAYFYDYDGETLLAAVPLTEGEAPHYDGETPIRERDKANKIQFEFEKWEKAEETASSIKYIASYASCTDGLDISGGTVTYYHGTSSEVQIPSFWGGQQITTIGANAFGGNRTATSVTIPSSVTSINSRAFSDCSSLKEVIIQNGLTTIGSDAFSGCSSLESVIVPESVTSIGRGAFYHCSSLTEITIPNGVTFIPDYTYNGCSSLESIVIPDSITSIGMSAFGSCSSLKNVEMADSVTFIAQAAFSNCTSLRTIFIPSTVTFIGGKAFDDCGSILIVCESEYKPSSWDGLWCGDSKVVWGYKETISINGIDYVISSIDGVLTAIVFHCDDDLVEVSIPDKANEATVIDIAPSAFYDCLLVKTVTIPSTVSSIGDRLFLDCSSLESITIPPSVSSIGRLAFYNCSSLKSLTIPNGVTTIGYCAFSGCNSLAFVIVPVTTISFGQGAFWCSGYLFYEGSSEQYALISRSDGGKLNAPYYYSETEPLEAGSYWHYVDGVPTIW